MSDMKLGKAVLEITIDDKQYTFAMDKIAHKSDETADHLKGIKEAFEFEVFKELGQVAFEAIAKVAEGIVSLGERGSKVADVSRSFEILSEKAGATAATMLGSLREGVKGTINDFDLMSMANKALGSGLIKSSDDMRVLAEGSRILAKSTGGTTSEAFDKLTTAMAKGRVAGIKQLGLFVDSKEAVLQYANAHGVAVSQLTDEDRAAALSTAAIAALRDRLKEIPPEAADFGEKVEQAKVKLENFRDAVAVQVAQSPVLKAAMDAAGKAMSDAFGGNQTQAVQMVVSAIEQVAIWGLQAARVVVEGAGYMTDAFYGVRYILNAVLEGMALGVEKLNTFIADLATKASSLPVVGQQFAALADFARRGADQAHAMALGFGEIKDQAVQSSNVTSTALGVVDAALGKVVSAMEAAQGASHATAEEAKGAIMAGAEGARESATRSLDDATKIKDRILQLQNEVNAGTKVGLDRRLADIETARQQEITKIQELKNITAAEYTQMTDLVNQKYAQQAAAARAGSDEIRDRTLALQQEILVATTTGLEQKQAQLDFQQQKEIAGLAFLQANYAAKYQELVALVQQKYQLMSDAASGHFTNVAVAAAAAGYQTRAELEHTATRAVELYEAMKASGLFTTKEIQDAFVKAENAKRVAKGESTKSMMTSDQAYMTGAQEVLGVLGEKHKSAAIAGAIIATYAAVAKALASAPWPASLALAAGALAAGMANVAKIRSSPGGYKEGTPNLDFAGFGREFPTVLHGNEAVIPQGRGHLLAGEIAAAMGGGGDGSNAGSDRMLRAIEELPGQVRRAMISGMQFAAR